MLQSIAERRNANPKPRNPETRKPGLVHSRDQSLEPRIAAQRIEIGIVLQPRAGDPAEAGCRLEAGDGIVETAEGDVNAGGVVFDDWLVCVDGQGLRHPRRSSLRLAQFCQY